MLKTIIIGIVVTIVGLFALAAVQRNSQDNQNGSSLNGYPTSQTISGEGNEIKVSIRGEINHPGQYSLFSSNTLGELIKMAGGVTEKADRSAYNESVVISTYTSFYIPPVTQVPSSCVETEISKVNINKAGKEELTSIGFNSSQASALIDYRNDNGPFHVLEDILKVKGIGEATFERVKNKIRLS